MVDTAILPVPLSLIFGLLALVINFESSDTQPIQDDTNLFGYNVNQIADEFVALMQTWAQSYRF